ncbi:hypothetical protein J6590_047350 [Homalodisca vitripennis]|nr:hypothetical protein J6590_047350 [Homalodisca vitripennis]
MESDSTRTQETVVKQRRGESSPLCSYEGSDPRPIHCTLPPHHPTWGCETRGRRAASSLLQNILSSFVCEDRSKRSTCCFHDVLGGALWPHIELSADYSGCIILTHNNFLLAQSKAHLIVKHSSTCGALWPHIEMSADYSGCIILIHNNSSLAQSKAHLIVKQSSTCGTLWPHIELSADYSGCIILTHKNSSLTQSKAYLMVKYSSKGGALWPHKELPHSGCIILTHNKFPSFTV